MPRHGRCNESEHKGVGEVLLDEQAAHRTGTRGNRENNRPAVIGGANRRTYLEENVVAVGVAAGERYPQAGMASVRSWTASKYPVNCAPSMPCTAPTSSLD